MRFKMCLVTALTLSSLTLPVWAADSVMLNPHIVLTKDVLTVGDLFEGVTDNADHVLAPAPQAGNVLTLTQAELQRVADTFHLDWHSDDANLTATVERDAVVITPDVLAKALGTSDLAQKIDLDAEIAVQTPVNGLVINGQTMPDIAFEHVFYNPSSQSFTATAVLSRPNEKPVRADISGLATKMLDVPVLKEPVDRGTRIGSGDIAIIRLPAHDVRAIYASRADDVIGMMSRRGLDAGKPLNKADLAPPVLVHRNEIVTVIYKNGAMSLTTKARALANAVKGDTVQLENPSSKKIIEATVTGPQQTTISIDTPATIVNG